MKIYLPTIQFVFVCCLAICASHTLSAQMQLATQIPTQLPFKLTLPAKLLESSAQEIFRTLQQHEKEEEKQLTTLVNMKYIYSRTYGTKKTVLMLEKLADFLNENNIYNSITNRVLNDLAIEYLLDTATPKEKITSFIATCEKKFLHFSAKKDCNASKYLLLCARINEKNLPKCQKYLDKAYKEAQKTNCYESMVESVVHKSVYLYEKHKDYASALSTRLHAVQLIDSFNREKKIRLDYKYYVDLYEQTANLHYKVNNYQLALAQWEKCLNLLAINEIKQSRSYVFITNNIGLCHFKMDNYEKALSYFENTIQIAKNTKDTMWVGIANGNIGDVFVAKKQYNAALSYLNVDAKTSIQFKEYDNATKTILQIAECYVNLENTTKARIYLDSTERMLTQHYALIASRLSNDVLQIKLKLHKNWVDYYIKTDNKKLTEMYFKSFLAIGDSINKFQTSEKLSNTQKTFDSEYEKAQKRIKALENEQISLKTIIFTIAFFTLLLIGCLFLRDSRMKMRITNTRNKQLIAVAQANSQQISDLEIIKEQSKSITASIEYAKIIQQSILPSNLHINKILENKTFFTIYQPKDIVSGDFYWIQQKQDKIIIVLADCTGHGVPGAMMSMLANELLHKKVFQKNILEPEIMLKDLYIMLKKRLNMKETKRYDGMDIAMLVYDKNTKILDFASVGSVCACYVKDNIVNEFPRNEIYVPMLLLEDTEIPDFEKFSITLDKPTKFYMFSDGITDQFDSEYRKKFGKKSFVNLLQQTQEIPLNQQKNHIETVISDWKKDAPQTDDISLLGFEV